ncbi:MAG TPA: hypothetical protein VHM71_09930 [Candidatus Deferrimicrobium sp.]|nr:hypothetical protein [Candidatus Deferrimicrobium sp.]
MLARTLFRYPSPFFRSASTKRIPEASPSSRPTRFTIAASFFGLTVSTVPKAGIPSSVAFLAVSRIRSRTHASHRRPRSGSSSIPRAASSHASSPPAPITMGKGSFS